MADETNLLAETLEMIALHGRHVSEVRWVGDGRAWVAWPEFAEQAGAYTYDAGFGGVEVNSDLKVVAEDWWLERHEYDGSEWWEFKTLPQRPDREELVRLRPWLW